MAENEIFKNGKMSVDVAPRTLGILKTSIQFSTQDQGTAKLIFSLSKDGLPLPLSSAAMGKIFLRMADGSVFEKNVSVVDRINGKLEYVLQEEISHPGLAKGELNIHFTNGQALSVCKFSFNIDASLMDQDIVPLAEYFVKDFNTLKTDIEQRAVDINAAVDEMQTKVDEFESTAITLDPRLTTVEERVEDATLQLTDTTNDLKSGGLNILSEGAKGDGVAVESPAIAKTLALTAISPVQRVKIPDGTYLIDKTIVIPRGVHLELGQKAIIKPTSGNFNIFQLKPEGRITGGQVDLQSVMFTKSVFYLDAEDVFQFYGQSAVISDINVLNKVPTVSGAFTGTGILCEAKTNMGFIDNVKFNNLTFINFDKVIHLRVDPALDALFANDPNIMAWVNANYFFQITAQNFKYGIYMEGLGSVPRDVGGNMFTQCQFQAEPTTEAIVYCEGAYNSFDLFMWDLHKMDDSKPAIQFTKSSKFNRLNSAMQLEITESWKDEGYMNVISSPGNYVPDQRTLANRLSTPYKGQFNGNQDDAMINGNLRGYTVTQTKGPAPVGVLTDIFLPDSEQGPTWTMTTDIDYMNPIELIIDCSVDPVIYAQYIGTIHPWDSIPEGLRVEGWTGTEWIWLHEVKGNTSNDFLISPPYSAIDFLHKIKISFYGSPKADKKVTLGRLVAISSKNLGKAYIPQFTDHIPIVDANGVAWKIKINPDGTWANMGAAASPSITPVLPGDKSMAGNQDDILLLADKRYAVTSTGAVKTAGNIADMFSLKREAFCRWTAPTTVAPIVLEIDFGTTPIQYMESLGINFGWGESAKNIKIERVLASGGAYVQLANITNNVSGTVHIASRATNVYKIRLTISVANNANTLVRINRIFATAATTPPVTFVNIESDNKLFGNLEFATGKGPVMTSDDGSIWKASISNEGGLTWVKI
ncbi:BppU family phage baseplate upper protein [Peribacillus frigoritolerans]